MHLVLANQWYPPESGWGGVAMWNDALADAIISMLDDAARRERMGRRGRRQWRNTM